MADKTSPHRHTTTQVPIDVSTAIIRVNDDTVQCRIIHGEAGLPDRLPFGPFMPERHRTMEIGLRHFVLQQVGVELGHVEQLYTFADQSRHMRAPHGEAHIVSVGYLALTNQPTGDEGNADWQDIYNYFPWEDGRKGMLPALDEIVLPRLTDKLAHSTSPTAHERTRRAFGQAGHIWDEEQALTRYELLYEAGLVAEALTDGRIADLPDPPLPGIALQLDHRRILATALARLRGKLKYRPVIFDLMPKQFTLTALQTTTEAVMGTQLHKQNFRRLVEKSGLVIGTGKFVKARGRPAELFQFVHNETAERPLSGLRVQSQRKTPQPRS